MPSLVALPTEMIAEIAESLRPPDLKNFSLTSFRLRHAISHILFRTLNIACPLVSDMLLEHMLKKYRHAIRRIHLHIRLRPNLPEDDLIEYDEVPSIWGTYRSDTLSQLVRGKIFSHINSFSVHFDPSQFDLNGCWFGDGGDWGGAGESIFVFHYEEDDEDAEDMEGDELMLSFEEMYTWRAQYNEAFADLTMNPNITKLRFVDLLPKRASSWYSDEWDSMLKRLTHFDVSIFGAQFGGRSGSDMPGFVEFIDEFPMFIEPLLTNVKHLRLEASPLSVFGTDVNNCGQAPFALYTPASALHTLELKNIIISIEVLSYLKKIAGTLRELTLHNCMCQTSEQGSDVEWAEVWDTVSNFKVLRRLTFLQDRRPPLVSLEDDERIAKRIVKKNKDRIVWRYVEYDLWQGTVREDGDANVQEVAWGRAYEKYCDLQETLKERRENSTEE